jgi:hypothetical protein
VEEPLAVTRWLFHKKVSNLAAKKSFSRANIFSFYPDPVVPLLDAQGEFLKVTIENKENIFPVRSIFSFPSLTAIVDATSFFQLGTILLPLPSIWQT